MSQALKTTSRLSGHIAKDARRFEFLPGGDTKAGLFTGVTA